MTAIVDAPIGSIVVITPTTSRWRVLDHRAPNDGAYFTGPLVACLHLDCTQPMLRHETRFLPTTEVEIVNTKENDT